MKTLTKTMRVRFTCFLAAAMLLGSPGLRAADGPSVFLKLTRENRVYPPTITIDVPGKGWNYGAAAPVSGTIWNYMTRTPDAETVLNNTVPGAYVWSTGSNRELYGPDGTLSGVILNATHIVTTATTAGAEPGYGSPTITSPVLGPEGLMQRNGTWRLGHLGNFGEWEFSGLPVGADYLIYCYGGIDNANRGSKFIIQAEYSPDGVETWMETRGGGNAPCDLFAEIDGVIAPRIPVRHEILSNAAGAVGTIWGVMHTKVSAAGKVAVRAGMMSGGYNYITGFQVVPYPKPLVVTHPEPTTTAVLDFESRIKVVAKDTTYLYEAGEIPFAFTWQVSRDDGQNWTDIEEPDPTGIYKTEIEAPGDSKDITSALIIIKSQYTDAGWYRAKITNGVGGVTYSNHSIVTVIDTPEPFYITQQPGPVTVVAGGNASLSVSVAGTPPFKFFWEKSDTPDFASSERIQTSALGNAASNTLNLTAMSKLNVGYYRARITDARQETVTPENPIYSDVVSVYVEYAKPAITPPGPQTVVPGKTVSFYGNVVNDAESYSPITSYQWQVSHDNGVTWTNVTDGGAYSGATTGTLTITGATDAQAGLYRLAVDNSITTAYGPEGGINYSDAFSLRVGEALVAHPVSVAADKAGRLYVSDDTKNVLYQFSLTSGTAVLFAGQSGVAGSADGYYAQASFNGLSGAVAGAANTIYIADTLNHTIRAVQSTGEVKTIAGSPSVSGNLDATGVAAAFTAPVSVSYDAAGNAYVADNVAHTIRRISPVNYDVTTLAGSAGNPGFVSGTTTESSLNSIARFTSPGAIVVSPVNLTVSGTTVTSGTEGPTTTIYVADTGNNVIRRILLTWYLDRDPLTNTQTRTRIQRNEVSTFAGISGVGGFEDGLATAAKFNQPSGIATYGNRLYVADTGNNAIRVIYYDSGTLKVGTVSGLPTISGYQDGPEGNNLFNQPRDISIDGEGNIYVADTGNAAVRKLSPVVSSVASGTTATYTYSAATMVFSQGTTPTHSGTDSSGSGSNVPPLPPAGYGDGGGAPSLWFLGALAALALSRVPGMRKRFMKIKALFCLGIAGVLGVAVAPAPTARAADAPAVFLKLSGQGGTAGDAPTTADTTTIAAPGNGWTYGAAAKYPGTTWNVFKMPATADCENFSTVIGVNAYISINNIALTAPDGTASPVRLTASLDSTAVNNKRGEPGYNNVTSDTVLGPAALMATGRAWNIYYGSNRTVWELTGLAQNTHYLAYCYGATHDTKGARYIIPAEYNPVTSGSAWFDTHGGDGTVANVFVNIGGVIAPRDPAPLSVPANTAPNIGTTWGVLHAKTDATGKLVVRTSPNAQNKQAINAFQIVPYPKATIITQPAAPAPVAIGGGVTFTVTATGFDAADLLTYQWRKNGTDIAPATNATAITASLSLTALQLVDNDDNYDVVVTNYGGSVTSSQVAPSVVAGNVAPSISALTSSQAAFAGASLTLSVTASGFPLPSYQWYKDGVAIPGATSSTYTIDNIDGADAGDYTVVIDNGIGSPVTSNPVTITIATPPAVFVKLHYDQSSSPGVMLTTPSTITINEQGSGWPYSGAAPYPGTTWNKILRPNSADMIPASVPTGAYPGTIGAVSTLITANNIALFSPDGTASGVKFTAQVHINGLEGDRQEPNSGYISGYNETLMPAAVVNSLWRLIIGTNTFTFTFSDLPPQRNYLIYFYGALNNGNARFDLAPANVLDTGATWVGLKALDTAGTHVFAVDAGTGNIAPVPAAIPNDETKNYNKPWGLLPVKTDASGQLAISAARFDGNTYVGGFQLIPYPNATIITQPPAAATVTKDNDITLTVIAAGFDASDPLIYQWRKDGVAIDTTANSTAATPALTLYSVPLADDGSIYDVVITNRGGKTTSGVTVLTVSESNIAPVIIIQPVQQTATTTGSASFTVSANGTSPLTYTWQKSTTGIADADFSNIDSAANPTAATPTLSLAGITTADAAYYRVKISNGTLPDAISDAMPLIVTPVITTAPVAGIVSAGAATTLTVVADIGVITAAPFTPTYVWKRNGTVVTDDAGAGISGATTATLSFTNFAAASSDYYTVTVYNDAGSVTTAAVYLGIPSTQSITRAPATASTGIAIDQQLRLVFPSMPKIGRTGKITIHDADGDAVVATIDVSQFTTFTLWSATIKNAAARTVQGRDYAYMPVAVYGNEIWITLSPTQRLSYGKTYYVNMEAGTLLDSTGAAVPAITGTTAWSFSTKASGPATPTATTGPTTITVGLDGTGDFATIQGASDWIPQSNTLPRTILVKPGVYHDAVVIAQNRNFVTLRGDGASRIDTVISYPYAAEASNGMGSNERSVGTLRVDCDDVNVRNLTVDCEAHLARAENGAPAYPGPINAVHNTAKRLVYENVLIKGGQDSLYANAGIAHFRDCEIWGTTDFIYGSAMSVFDQCDIVSLGGGWVTAPATAYDNPYGYVFLNCRFIKGRISTGHPSDVPAASIRFQRPWRQDGMTAVINCQLDDHISVKGWDDWGNGSGNTCRAREYGSTLIAGGDAPTIAQRQAAGAYWLNTIDPDYTNGMEGTNPLIDGAGQANRIPANVDPADYTLDAIYGHAYYNLGTWRPSITPRIDTQPVEQNITAGDTLTLTVGVADVYPAPTIQWYRDDVAIDGATSATLNLTNAQAANGGSYYAILTNSAGSVRTTPVTVTVTGGGTDTAPSITTQPAQQTALATGNATFTVAAAGTPPLVYSWQFSNTGTNAADFAPIASSNTNALTLTGVTTADAGYYRVTVSNGTPPAVTSDGAPLIIAPVITTQPTGGEYTTGTNITLTVAADTGLTVAPFAPGYLWYKGTQAIATATNASYTITGVQETDSGNYHVVVSNIAGSGTSAIAALTVTNGGTPSTETPVIASQPVSQITAAGAPVTLSVNATGGALSYQWFKDGALLAGETGSTLTIASPTAANAGSYYVEITNASGTAASTTVTLTVETGAAAPAVFLNMTTDRAANGAAALTAAATMSIAAPGSGWNYSAAAPCEGTTWNKIILPGDNDRPIGTELGIYQFNTTKNITLTTSGGAASGVRMTMSLVCTATNSRPEPSRINPTIATPILGPSDLMSSTWRIYDGGNATLLEFTGLPPAAHYLVYGYGSTNNTGEGVRVNIPAANSPSSIMTWFETSANADASVFVQTGDTISPRNPAPVEVLSKNASNVGTTWGLVHVVVDSTGNLTVSTGLNENNKQYVTGFQVIPYPKAAITTQPDATTFAVVGETATLEVIARSVVTGASDNITYQWRKGGVPINTAESPSANTDALIIADAQLADSGSYDVVITNHGGSVISDACQLTVSGAAADSEPAITAQPVSTITNAGDSITLSVTATGGALSYQWYKDGVLLSGETGATLTIANPMAADAGSYHVVVTNSLGEATSTTVTVTVESSTPAGAVFIKMSRDSSTQPGVTLTTSDTMSIAVQGSGWNYSAAARYDGTVWNKILMPNSADSINSNSTGVNGTFRVKTADGISLFTPSGAATAATLSIDIVIADRDGNTTRMEPNYCTGATTALAPKGLMENGWRIYRGGNSAIYTLNGLAHNTHYIAYFYGAAGANQGSRYVLDTANTAVSTAAWVETIGPANTEIFASDGTNIAPKPASPQATAVVADEDKPWGLLHAITDATGKLVFTTTRSAAAGQYYQGFQLIPYPKAVIDVDVPSTLSTPTGGTTTITITALGFDAGDHLSYQWRKDGVAINTADNPTANTASLVITDTQDTDEGDYDVVITNYGGSITSGICTVETLAGAGAPTIFTQPVNQTGVVNGTVTLSVAAGGQPPLTYVWQKSANGTDFTDLADSNSSSRVLAGIATADAGYYRVKITNPQDSAGVLSTAITLIVKPVIITQPGSAVIAIGSPATLTVVADAGLATAPFAPTYQWQLDGTDIPGATSASYTIPSFAAGDAGAYTVTVTNAAGATTSEAATLAYPTLPAFTTQPVAALTAVNGIPVRFVASATGIPAPTYQWNFNGAPIASATNATYTIASVTLADSGTYTVVATNMAGNTTSDDSVLTVRDATGPAIVSDGFGSTATGGAGGPTYVVTTAADLLEKAKLSGPAIITVSGTINLIAAGVDKKRVGLTANKTLQGADANALIVGEVGIYDTNNVIVRGLTITHPGTTIDTDPTSPTRGKYLDSGDGINVWNSTNVFITHCTIYDCGDGCIDITRPGTRNVTVSWCKFYYTSDNFIHRFTMILGNIEPDDPNYVAPNYTTLHHNWWAELCHERMPAATSARGHMYGNYFTCAGNFYSSNARNNTHLLVEHSYYGTGVNNPVGKSAGTTGLIRTINNIYNATTGSIDPGTDTVFTPSYSYQLDDAADIPALMPQYGGNTDGAFSVTPAVAQPLSVVASTTTPLQGDTVTLVPSLGNAGTAYQWRLNNFDIAGATSETLTLPNFQSANLGAYTVVVTTAPGKYTVSSPTTLVFGPAPSFPNATGGAIAAVTGKSVTLSPAVNGEELNYQWQRYDGSAWVNITDDSTYSGATTGSLTIANIGDAQAGQYRLVVTNPSGPATTDPYTLSIAPVLFPHPTGIALDSYGDLYVADSALNVIRKIAAGGTTATLYAGIPNSGGFKDGAFGVSTLNFGPYSYNSLAIDATGNLYVVDTGNKVVRRVNRDGSLTTLAGDASGIGNRDGIGTAALFSSPNGISFDRTNGATYVADTNNHTIRKLTPMNASYGVYIGNIVATINGVAGVSGDSDAPMTLSGSTLVLTGTALYNHPAAVAYSGTCLYVADAGNNTIRKFILSGSYLGEVTTLAGMPGASGYDDGAGMYALFNQPKAIVTDASGSNIYIADTGNHTIRRVTRLGVVTTLAGLPTVSGLADGVGEEALFNQPSALALDISGSNLYVADTGNATVRKIVINGTTATVSTLSVLTVSDSLPPSGTVPPFTPGDEGSGEGGGAGGGGAPTHWYLSALAALALLRLVRWGRKS